MTYIPFDELNIKLQSRNKKQPVQNFTNNGLDTETYKGTVALLCDDSGKFIYPDNIYDILQFLTRSKFENSYNWFFNIRFDFESLIKIVDDLDILTDIYNEKWYSFDNYRISYLDNKFFKIENGKHCYQFYDLANFIQSSLNKASKEFLNKEKLDIIDAKRLNLDSNYWLDNAENIKKYCIQDCILTKELADYLLNLMQRTVEFIPNKMFSKGSYSQEYFLYNCYIPTINKINKNVLRYAYNSYSGGRFELIRRGYFDSAYTYDIRSAYPYHMANLLDINYGNWYEVSEYKEKAYYGYYLCEIMFYHDVFSPFMQKISGLNVYPNGIFYQYLTQNEISFILKNFSEVDINIKSGYVFYPDQYIYPLRNKILELYFWKEEEKNPDIRYLVKIILNSLYGKFIQKIGGRTGQLFNPIWATEITANTRLQLLNFVLNDNPKNKTLNNLIGFSTDSVHSMIELNPTNKNPGWKNLGDFSLDYKGEGIFIMSDIYSLWNEKKEKNKFRGFSIKIDGEYKTIKNLCGNSMFSNEYKYYQIRPKHLGETLQRKIKNIDDINKWFKFPKTIDFNGDCKRLWNRDFENGWDCFYDQHESSPIMIEV